MKNLTVILVVIIIISLAVVAADYIWWNKLIFKKPDEDLETKKTSGNASSGNNSSNTQNSSSSFPLMNGSKGLEVKYLQAGLNTFQGQNLKVDGVFGSATQNALYKIFKVKVVPEKDYNIWVKPYIPEIKRRYELQGIIL